MKRLLVCGALLASGCGRNAYLELDVALPPGSGRFAVIGLAAGPRPFAGTWAGDDTLPGIALEATATHKAISVEGNSDTLDKVVEVKVSFCVQADCLGTNDDNAPEAHLTLEKAFYEGKRTGYTWQIDCIPTVDAACKAANPIEKTAGKCEVSGCRSGTSSNYCVGGKHFCED